MTEQQIKAGEAALMARGQDPCHPAHTVQMMPNPNNLGQQIPVQYSVWPGVTLIEELAMRLFATRQYEAPWQCFEAAEGFWAERGKMLVERSREARKEMAEAKGATNPAGADQPALKLVTE